jgi:hypothetical protein
VAAQCFGLLRVAQLRSVAAGLGSSVDGLVDGSVSLDAASTSFGSRVRTPSGLAKRLNVGAQRLRLPGPCGFPLLKTSGSRGARALGDLPTLDSNTEAAGALPWVQADYERTGSNAPECGSQIGWPKRDAPALGCWCSTRLDEDAQRRRRHEPPIEVGRGRLVRRLYHDRLDQM